MGNRAIIKTETGHIGVYLHWNGGRDSVEAFLKYCDLRGFRSPESDGYGWARFAQVVGNFFGGGLSIGMVEVNHGGNDGEGCDNGAYIIKKWEIIGREGFEGREQSEYDLNEMLLSIDEAQPEKERIGEYLRGREIQTAELKAGDEIILPLWSGEMKRCTVLGFGSARYVNGHMVEGVPFVDAYNRGTGNEADNPNNYITTDTVRLAPTDTTAEEPEEENPVEIFVNDALNGIELKFSRKPDEQTREALKSSGWRWHRKRCVWYTKNNPGNMEMAKRIAAAVTEQTENPPRRNDGIKKTKQQEEMKMDYEAAKRMEDFAKEILRQTPAMQKKMWEAIEPILTADEIRGLKCYVGLFHMFTDQRYFEAVKKSVGEQLYTELHK